eukprot:12886587-Prorocentrum_lima.AAC.1
MSHPAGNKCTYIKEASSVHQAVATMHQAFASLFLPSSRQQRWVCPYVKVNTGERNLCLPFPLSHHHYHIAPQPLTFKLHSHMPTTVLQACYLHCDGCHTGNIAPDACSTSE